MGKSHEKRAVLTAMTEARRTDTCAGAGRRGRHRGTVCDAGALPREALRRRALSVSQAQVVGRGVWHGALQRVRGGEKAALPLGLCTAPVGGPGVSTPLNAEQSRGSDTQLTSLRMF